MLERIAHRASHADSSTRASVFAYQSVVPACPADVFRWHERPEAVMDLVPSRRWTRIEKQSGGIRNGGRVTFSFGVGPLRLRWEARHYGYVPGSQFCDEQIRGPFKIWRHTHQVESSGHEESLYKDFVEYALPGGALAQRLAQPIFRRLLTRMFAHRHQIVRKAMTGVSHQGL
jgi:ligand-binding SRPBCC domain-containing protein